MTLDLVLDIGSSALNEIRKEPKWLSPKGPQEGVPVIARNCWRCLHTRLHRVLHIMTEIAQMLCFFNQCPLMPQSSLCPRLVVLLSPAYQDGLVWVIRTSPLSFPLLLPPKSITFYGAQIQQCCSALPLCTNLIISLGASRRFTRAKLSSISDG